MKVNLCFGCMKEKTQAGPCPHCGFDENTYVPEPHHLPPGTVLSGKYLLGRVLGEGGFGITYIGWDLNLELRVAIKEYYPNGFVSRNSAVSQTLTVFTGQKGDFFERGLERFVDEARRLGKFWGMSGIVGVKDYFRENKTAYIVMEFAEGQTLKELLGHQPQGRLPAAQVFEMMRPVMDALEAVHAAGIIHRDISPDNLMVDPKGNVRLLDFGAARNFLAAGEKSLSVMLKPGYAPEEQYRSKGVQGPWTDVYGLCATMYRAITGQVPEESLDRLESDTLKWPSQSGIAITPSQERALMTGLAVFQKNRFQNIGALRQALYAYGSAAQERPWSGMQPGGGPAPVTQPAGGSAPVTPPGVGPAPVTRPHRRLWWILGGAVGGAVILAIAIVMIFAGPAGTGGADGYADRREDTQTEESGDRFAADEDTAAGETEGQTEPETQEPYVYDESSGEPDEPPLDEALRDRGVDPQEDTAAEVNVRLDHQAVEALLNDSGSGADYGVCIVDAPTGTMYNGELCFEPMKASAMTNICILYTIAYMCDNGYMTLDDEVLFTYYVDGRGILTREDDGTYFPARTLVEYMLVFGDDNAANSLMEYILIDNINYVCVDLFEYTSVDVQYLYGEGENYVCAGDVAMMLYDLHTDYFSSIGSEFMNSYFYIDDSSGDMGMVRAIPSDYAVLDHNAVRSDLYNEAMIVMGEDAYYFVVIMSQNGDPQEAADAMAEAAELIHRDLAAPLE